MKRRTSNEAGIALIIALLLMFIFTLMALGFFFVVNGEQKIAASDRDNSIAFYGAEAGLEKMSAQLVNLFQSTASPSTSQVDSLWNGSPNGPPTIPGVTFPTYQINYTTVGSPPQLQSSVQQIGGSGPLSGLQGLITPFTLNVVAQSVNGAEVKLTRQVQEVAVPVFQFGIYSDNDLSFFAGPPFNFGGRVHTNGNLFLAEGDTATGLSLADKVTAYKDVIRAQLSNGFSTSTNYAGIVNVVVSPGTYRNLGLTEGSVTAGPGSSPNPNWPTLSKTTYNGNIKTQLTGATKLNLAFALAAVGPKPIEIIRRPPVGESPTSDLGRARFFNQASLRILMSDNPTWITTLPGVTSAAPFPLNSSIYGLPYSLPAADACHPPLAQSPGYTVDNDYMSPVTTSLLAGASTSYIKIEIQLASTPGTWQDVTKEVLSLGISKDVGTTCLANKSILHLQQLRASTSPPAPPVAGSVLPTDYIPINMYDPREGELRDNSGATNVALGGIMNLVELDVSNLQKWFATTLDPGAPSGALALNNSGYIVYFSDRRSNTNGTGETGEYGFEDIINPLDANGTPDGVLDVTKAEDVNGNNILDVYGKTPRYSFTPDSSTGSTWPAWFATPPTPLTRVSSQLPLTGTGQVAQKNSVIFFRRALRLVNGQVGNLPPLTHSKCTGTAGGFTVAAENPIYVLGDYNADPVSGFNDKPNACHVPAAVIGDAVTVLSDGWNDSNSFSSPTSPAGRLATTTYYRMAIIGGKNNSFPQPTWPGAAQDFGTDGGTHNFIRYIENWGGQTLNYSGSLLSFYIARQAIGIYKCCAVVYSPPGTRAYSFDLDFTNINSLPPGTPRFSDVNALAFQQTVLPN